MAQNLVKLGKLLEERRQAVGIPRAEIARRVGVSASYVWTVERARKRKSGDPSRPSQGVLQRWATALGWGEPYLQQLLSLAGHGGTAAEQSSQPPPPMVASVLHYPQPQVMEREQLHRRLDQLLDRAAASQNTWEAAITELTLLIAWIEHRTLGDVS
jgi:transcriptional regulator with XRE-family HTH domain